MCGIAGIVSLDGEPIPGLERRLRAMNRLLAHRGPDGEGVFIGSKQQVGLGHRRLSIIDLTETGGQPMSTPLGSVITYNGEIYNYLELREELSSDWTFRSTSDTEVILAAYHRWGADCVSRLRGMFAFALWDEKAQSLFCACDRVGIKPLYHTRVGGLFLFASEAKALLPFLDSIDTNMDALGHYLTFQHTLDEQTLFKGIDRLMPSHLLTVKGGRLRKQRYWDLVYDTGQQGSPDHYAERLKELVDDSIRIHLRSDVPVGGYISGGIDSTLVSILAAKTNDRNRQFFHGKFSRFPAYDESGFAEIAANHAHGTLHQLDISAGDFRDEIENVVYHLDFPVAGPGAFPQYMVSQLAAKHVKVVFGGQGGDEIFGGYARYLVAYFEQCIKAALEGTYRDGNYVVTIESIIPNLESLREYKPMIRNFWKDGLFGELDARYFRLIDRSSDITDEIDWSVVDTNSATDSFQRIFNEGGDQISYFDKMTRYDFKCLLPALLHVEDRMSMAHGLESRVPLLDHEVIEFAATVPAGTKFRDGHMKHLIKTAYADILPAEILERRDKMGFPVPLKEWFDDELRDFVTDTLTSSRAKARPYINPDGVQSAFESEFSYSRKAWGLLSLELWHKMFHDKAGEWKAIAQ